VILLDTQALVWLMEANPRLGLSARARIERERAGDGAMVAAISVWEAAMLVDKGKLVLSRPVASWFEVVLATPGFRLAEMTVAIGADAGALPGDIHGDPADRLIIATARALGCPLLTTDRQILVYAEAGYLQAIDASR
jgi:PIN domain nuclease of toxin-antitoxin system